MYLTIQDSEKIFEVNPISCSKGEQINTSVGVIIERCLDSGYDAALQCQMVVFPLGHSGFSNLAVSCGDTFALSLTWQYHSNQSSQCSYYTLVYSLNNVPVKTLQGCYKDLVGTDPYLLASSSCDYRDANTCSTYVTIGTASTLHPTWDPISLFVSRANVYLDRQTLFHIRKV